MLAGLVVATWARARLRVDSAAAWAWPIAAAVALAPSVYPWYLLWFTPFLFTPATRPLAVWTVTILATYVALSLERIHGPLGLRVRGGVGPVRRTSDEDDAMLFAWPGLPLAGATRRLTARGRGP